MTVFSNPVATALQLMGGKWKIAILYNLRNDAVRFGELKRRLAPITQQMLTKQLRELESDRLINRQVFEVIPPRVDYSLTDLGRSFMPVINALCQWSKDNQEVLLAIAQQSASEDTSV